MVNYFCRKVVNWMIAKALPPMWVKVDELQSERMEVKMMQAADVMSRVVERAYRKELEEKKKRFLSNKRLEYNR